MRAPTEIVDGSSASRSSVGTESLVSVGTLTSPRPVARFGDEFRSFPAVPSLTSGVDPGLLPLQGRVERMLVSEGGYVLVTGWLADEGSDPLAFRVTGAGLDLLIPADSILRHARGDVETIVRAGAYDYGFLAFARSPSPAALKQPLAVEVGSANEALRIAVGPQVVSDRRLLDALLIAATGQQAHGGATAGLHRFAAGAAGSAAVALFQSHAAGHVARCHVHRFRPRPVARSFVTVLFGATEPVKLQPILFRQGGIDFGEWIYVCNSPEDAEAVMRLGRLVSDLYDVAITVMVMPDNVGFGAANNAAVAQAASDSIVLVNPDVYPLPGHAGALRDALDRRTLGTGLWGGLLFYDDHNLMHSGMYLDRDTAFRRQGLGRAPGPGEASAVDLLRVEHFDKGVPFEEASWRRPKAVPAVTGAVMAFARRPFERLGGFSTRYIYGHYEDADLSLRWAAEGGTVAVDPLLRLVHLEGQGSKPKGEQYRAAAVFNRHLFTLRHGAAYDRDPGAFTAARDLAPGGA